MSVATSEYVGEYLDQNFSEYTRKAENFNGFERFLLRLDPIWFGIFFGIIIILTVIIIAF